RDPVRVPEPALALPARGDRPPARLPRGGVRGAGRERRRLRPDRARVRRDRRRVDVPRRRDPRVRGVPGVARGDGAGLGAARAGVAAAHRRAAHGARRGGDEVGGTRRADRDRGSDLCRSARHYPRALARGVDGAARRAGDLPAIAVGAARAASGLSGGEMSVETWMERAKVSVRGTLGTNGNGHRAADVDAGAASPLAMLSVDGNASAAVDARLAELASLPYVTSVLGLPDRHQKGAME